MKGTKVFQQQLIPAGFSVLYVLLLAVFLFSGCSQPGDAGSRVNALPPLISIQPAGGSWNVDDGAVFEVSELSALSRDGGEITYQWYSNTKNSNSGGTLMNGKTGEVLTLSKNDYASDGTRYFYAAVTNTIEDNGDRGAKTATIASNAVSVTVKGNVIITISSPAEIGSDEDHPLSGTYVLNDSVTNVTLANWLPIGDDATPFSGVFDGKGKTITLNGFSGGALNGKNHLGIFGYVRGDSFSAKAAIKNLNIVSSVDDSSTSASGQAIGLAAGYAGMAEIENITLSGTFGFRSGKTVYAGGAAGFIDEGTILKDSNSSLKMDISPGNGSPLVSGMEPYSYAGGFVGLFRNGAGIDNCHNTGNLTADNTVNTVSGQVFAGGIAGGSLHGFSTAYHGYIQDSSSTGIIIGRAKGLWTFAGGIAGTIVGGKDGDTANSTRIERCFAEGIVSAEGANSEYPYVGGIVGYNYYGALVSQSFFNGTVISDKEGDYTGGIAGYNSQRTNYTSRIEDCWSAGTVQGFNNAGGIAGQNQMNTYIRRCYSTAEIKTTSAAGNHTIGGIAGLHASTMTNAITACAALNTLISSGSTSTTNIHRVTGTTGGNRSNNRAWSGMEIKRGGTNVTPVNKGLSGADGEDCAEKPAKTFYETTLGWDFTSVWKMEAGDEYPRLMWQL